MPVLAALFARLGNLTFGGGDPTVAALHRELARRGWLTEEQFALYFSLSRVTPGTNVLAFCAATAWSLRGWLGAAVAVVSASVPAALAAVWLTMASSAALHHGLARGAIQGAMAGALGMMLATPFLLLRPRLAWNARFARGLLIAAGAAAVSYANWAAPVWVLLGAALLGYLWRTGE